MKRTPIVLAAALAATSASAHLGAGSTDSLASGFQHPFLGLDHICAMVAVGLWAATKGGRALYVWPAAFVLAMLVGGAMGLAHLPLPFVEPGILASLIVLGLLVASAANLPLPVGVAVIVTFAILHGHAHGSEATESTAGALYLVGFAGATSVLHLVGILLGKAFVSRSSLVVRSLGGVCALVGFGMAAGVI